MGKDKWAEFYSTHSPLRIDQPKEAGESTKLVQDWHRASETSRDANQPIQVYIDGKPLHTYASDYNDFQDEASIKDFFKTVLMGKMKKPVQNEKEIIDFLQKNLHQGGLLYPVSSALSVAVERDATKQEIAQNAHYVNDNRVSEATIGNAKQIVNIVPCAEGIKIQEHVEVDSIIVNEQAFDKFRIPYEDKKYPNGEPYRECESPTISNADGSPVIKAQGEVIVNCLKEKPEISIGHNAITYGEPRIEKAMDNRSLAQMFADFVKRALGLSKVNAIEVQPEHDAEAQSRDSPTL